MLGLALGSGGAMGFGHIGVLSVLESERIPVDMLAGTSIGAIIAAFSAIGMPAGEMEKIALGFKSRLKTLSLIDPTIPARGLIKGRALRRLLKTYLGTKTFADVKPILKIVACDIKRRREFVIDKGRLLDAVMASVAIPGVFEPVIYGPGIQLVDGGIVNPLPVSVLVRWGAKKIIAVNTLPSPEHVVRSRRKTLNIYDVIVNSLQATEYVIAQHTCRRADILLNPIPKMADWYELYKARTFIAAGRKAANDALTRIRELVQR